MPRSIDELAAIFERLGVRNPQAWAKSEIGENIPQLAGLLFLRQAWTYVVSEDDRNWPARKRRAEGSKAEAPFDGIGLALASLLEKGATPEELIDLVRGVQVQLLFNLCYLLDGPAFFSEGLHVQGVGWALMETDGAGQPQRPMPGLHELVLGTDPTGREMRPRPVDK